MFKNSIWHFKIMFMQCKQMFTQHKKCFVPLKNLHEILLKYIKQCQGGSLKDERIYLFLGRYRTWPTKLSIHDKKRVKISPQYM